MQFKNLSVAKKIWLLLIFVIAALLSVSFGTTTYLLRMDEQMRQQTAALEDRIRLMVQLRGNAQATASYLVAANMAQDAASMELFQQQFNTAAREAESMLEETQRRLQSQVGRAQMAKILAQRQKLMEISEQVNVERRSGGDVVGMVHRTLLPGVNQYLAELDQLVSIHEQRNVHNETENQAQRGVAMATGVSILLLVVILSLLISAWLVRQLTVSLQRAVDLAEAIAEGDLSRNVHDDRKDELGQLLRSLNTMTQKLRSVVGEVRNGVDSVSSAASQIATGNQDLSSRTEQTAANLQETAASIEELTATVTQSADTARQANQLAVTAVQAAERGGEVVSQVVMSMDQINTSSRKISDIIGVIDGIAFQTNILALNAAVEAARAGEQGRGFAVVAGEVRALAQRSAEAAKEIKALIETSVNNVDMGAEQVAQAGENMQEIVSSVRRVTDLIGEISASTSEQRDGFCQVNQAVSNLDQMTQQNAALVEESSAAAVAMRDQAQRLATVVSMFNIGEAHATLASSPRIARTAAPVAAAKPANLVKPIASKATPAVAKSMHQPAKPAATQAPKLVKPEPVAHKAANNAEDDWETF